MVTSITCYRAHQPGLLLYLHNAVQTVSCRLALLDAACCHRFHHPVLTAGLLMGQSKPAAASRLQTMTSNINLTDKWARIHLARLCSALVYAEWTSTQTFVSGVGAPMWKMLVMLATR